MNIHANKELLQKLHERKLIGSLPEKEPDFNQLIRYGGHFDIVRYFLEENLYKYEKQLPNDVISWASRYGNLEFIKYIVENNITWNKEIKILNNAISWASLNGHLEVIKYLIKKRGKIGIDSIKNASLNGHLKVIKYLIEKGGIITDDAIPYASKNGHLEVIKYLIEKGGKITGDAIPYALKNGHLEVIKYFVNTGSKITLDALYDSLKYCHLEVIKYFIEEIGLIPIYGINYVSNGISSCEKKLEVIKYLIKNGVKITINAIKYAIYNNNLSIIQYFIEEGRFDINYNNNEILIYCARWNRKDMVEFLIKNGANINVLDIETRKKYGYYNEEFIKWETLFNYETENETENETERIESENEESLIKTRKNMDITLNNYETESDTESETEHSESENEESLIKTRKNMDITLNNYETESDTESETEHSESENEESLIKTRIINKSKLIDKDRNKLYIVEKEDNSYFQIELLNKNKIIKLQKWNEIINLKYKFTKITNINNKNDINYCYQKYLKDFYGNEIPTDKKNDVLIDYQNFIEYNNKINEIRFKYTGKINTEYDINEKEDVYQNKYNKILVYNDNSHMSFIIDNPDKYDLQLLESNICGYKKYFEIKNNEIDSNINTTLISLFHEKYFDDEKSLIDKINSFKELFNIDDTLKRDVKTFISCNYNITDDINDKMKASELFNEIYKFLKIEEKINIRNKLTNFLLDIGLKKKRYNDGIYYYGLHKIK